MFQNFCFACYRFTYTVQEPLKMPPYKGNVFRGRFGYILHHIDSANSQTGASTPTALKHLSQTTARYSAANRSHRTCFAGISKETLLILRGWVRRPPMQSIIDGIIIKKIDIPTNLRYTYKHIRDGLITGEHLINCPRTQVVPCFIALFAEKSRIGQCTRGFAGFLGKILRQKKPSAVRVFFWVPEPRPHWA